jgi:ABC-2 type transport system permease protein
MVLMAAGLLCVGLVIASLIESLEGFNLIMSILIMPMFFLSGALFPIHILPTWMKNLTYINPLTYGVDALRTVIIGTSAFTMQTDLAILAVFAFFMLGLAVLTFERK